MSTQHGSPETPGIPEWTVAHRLRMAREDYAGMTQEQLADASGVSRRTIATYERPDHHGRRNPLYVRALADTCGVRIEWIWTGLEGGDGDDGGTRDLGIALDRCRVQPIRHLALAS